MRRCAREWCASRSPACEGEAIGSGFAVAPSLVATAAHVVTGGQVIRLIQGTSSTAGRVIGLDAAADVALVRTASPLRGTTLTFAAEPPRVGDRVGALGFPRAILCRSTKAPSTGWTARRSSTVSSGTA